MSDDLDGVIDHSTDGNEQCRWCGESPVADTIDGEQICEECANDFEPQWPAGSLP